MDENIFTAIRNLMKNEKEKTSRHIREAPGDSPVGFVFPGGQTEKKRKSSTVNNFAGVILITGIIAAAFYSYNNMGTIPFLKVLLNGTATIFKNSLTISSCNAAAVSDETLTGSGNSATSITGTVRILAKSDNSSTESTNYKKPSSGRAKSGKPIIDKVREYYNKGNVLSIKGDYGQAIVWYDKAIELDPGNRDIYFSRGLTLMNTGHLDKGIADLSKVIQLKPDDAEAYYYRAIAWAKKGDSKKSTADYDEAVKLNPDFTSEFYYRALVMAKNGDGILPAGYAEKFLSNKSDAESHTDKEKKIDKGKYEEDFALFDKAIRKNPDNFYAYKARGMLWLRLKNLDKAFADFNKVIELKPDYADAYLGRGSVFLRKGYKDRALEDFNKTIKLDPDNALAYASRGAIMIDRDEKLGCRDLRKACELKECAIIEAIKAKGFCR